MTPGGVAYPAGLLLGLLSTAAAALGPPQSIQENVELDFGVYFGRTTYVHSMNSTEISTYTDMIGISFVERFGSSIQVGVHGGNSFATQPDNTAIGGKEIAGKHVGIHVVSEIVSPRRSRLSLLADFSFTRHDLSDETDLQALSLKWSENQAGVWMWVSASSSLQFVVGARANRVSGTFTASGTTNADSTFEASGTGTSVGINFNDGSAGSVGYLANFGTGSGSQLYFRRQF